MPKSQLPPAGTPLAGRAPRLLAAAALLPLLATCATAQPTPRATAGTCADGRVGSHACSGVDLLAHLDLAALDAGSGNSLWGYVDAEAGKEYALMGLDNGVAFVDVSDPAAPVFVGKLPPHTENSTWRDVRVYDHYAFVVSEAPGSGMQVFDLHRLRGVAPGQMPVAFTEDAHYDNGEVSNVHTMAVTPETGRAYLVGTNTCNAGLHAVDVRNPLAPTFAGCFDDDGYTHEMQCWIYDGPDDEHDGREICAAWNEDTVTMVDMTDADAPRMLSRGTYPGTGYTHQGWFTDDMAYMLVNDEFDESQGLTPSARTIIMDMRDLDAPEYLGAFQSPVGSIDHNLYVRDGKVYQANYTAGLRILDLAGIADARLTEVAYFDTYPQNDDATFAGLWNVHPYLPSGTLIASDINGGLFILREGERTLLGLSALTATPGEGMVALDFTPAEAGNAPFTVERRFGERAFEPVGEVAAAGPFVFSDAGLAPGPYWYRLRQTVGGRPMTSSTVAVDVEGPPAYRVSAAAPNPFDDETELTLTVTANQHVRAVLVDAAGTELRLLHDGLVEADDSAEIEVEGDGLAPGVYYVRFEGEQFEGQRKLVRTR